MKHMDAQTLSELQRRERFMLLLTMLLFLTCLFALVSRWPVAYPLVVFACAFHLIANRVCKKRYRLAFTQALMEHAVQGWAEVVSFAKDEGADGLLIRGGLVPDVTFIPGAKQHHVLRGMANGVPFCVGEAAFIRKRANGAVESVAGTLVIAEDILPKDERWVMLCEGALQSVCSDEEYERGGYEKVLAGDAALPETCVIYRYHDAAVSSLEACAAAMRAQMMPNRPVALAARDGALTLFGVGAFFAPKKVDSTKPFDPRMLEGFGIPELEAVGKMIRMHGQR